MNRTSIAFLQIQDVLNNVYPRTFAVLAFILSGASFEASCGSFDGGRVQIANHQDSDSGRLFKKSGSFSFSRSNFRSNGKHLRRVANVPVIIAGAAAGLTVIML